MVVVVGALWLSFFCFWAWVFLVVGCFFAVAVGLLVAVAGAVWLAFCFGWAWLVFWLLVGGWSRCSLGLLGAWSRFRLLPVQMLRCFDFFDFFDLRLLRRLQLLRLLALP